MKLSIIVPAYNVEDFIEPCLKSLFDQDSPISNYEVIVIDDGSTDQTVERVRHFTKTQSNLQLITQPNKGLGGSRNTGVTVSKGAYIYFLDADDYLAQNTLGTLINVVEQFSPDILSFSSQSVKDNNHTHTKTSNVDLSTCQIYNGIDFLEQHNYRPEVWRYFIKKAFYVNHDMRFYDKKFVQDAYFTPTLISKAERIVRLPYDVHRYRVSNVSITRDKSDEHLKIHLKDLCYAVEKLFQLRQDLINKGVTNIEALRRIHIKQQRYVFIAITRFMRSSLEPSELKKMLSDFKAVDAYPLNIYKATLGLNDPLNLGLTFIFNKKILLYPSVHAFRIYKKFRKTSLK